jgi:hypothetical protein
VSIRFGPTDAEGAVVEIDIDEGERDQLVSLAAQLVELVSSSEPGDSGPAEQDPLAAMVGIGTATHLPLDPSLARLFPDAYHDDAVAAGDFRRYTEVRLREGKVRNAAVVTACLGRPSPLALNPEEVAAWLGTLNDLRLVLGVLLDVSEEDDVVERLEEPGGDGYLIYLWLTDLQGALLEALA